jgi:hypothetical protein
MRALPARVAFAALLSLAGCPHPASPDAAASPGRYGVPHEDVVEQGNPGGVTIDLVTPRFTRLPQPGGDLLNAALAEATAEVRAEATAAQAARTPEELAERPDLSMGAWARYEIRYVDARWLSVRQDLSTFLGGAHPDAHVRTYLFDLDQGVIVSLPELFTDRGWRRFDAHLRAALRAELRRLGADPSPVDAWLGPTTTTAFVLQPDALIVTLQPYDIGPWALGAVEVALPWPAVTNGLRDGLALPPSQDPRF